MTATKIHTKRLLLTVLFVTIFCMAFYNIFVLSPSSSTNEYNYHRFRRQSRVKGTLISDERERRQVFDEKLALRLENMNLQMDTNKASIKSIVHLLSELQRLIKSMSVQQEQYVDMQNGYSAKQQQFKDHQVKLESVLSTLKKEYEDERAERMREREYGQRKLARLVRAEKEVKQAHIESSREDTLNALKQKKANEELDAKDQQMEEERIKHELHQQEDEMKEREQEEQEGKRKREVPNVDDIKPTEDRNVGVENTKIPLN